ncbi:MAG: alpha/beta hydrolase [Acidobacteriota bacterium]|nr:alpha/beta hydrolase [Acidobacteriota bacterium]
MFHPIRIAAILAVGLPLVLLLLTVAAGTSGHAESSRVIYRTLRYCLVVELICGLILACVGAIYQSVSAARERQTYHPPGKLVDVGGYRLHLYCSGTGGPTVLLDYGLVGTYLDWAYVQPEVAKFTRVCSYDRGGYGWSDPSPKERLPGVMAEELHTLLSNAGVTPPYIVAGHSFGAFNALAFARLFPRETAGVILIDGSHPDESIPFGWRNKLWLRTMQLTLPFGLPRWRKWCGGGDSDTQGIKTAITCRSQYQQTYYRQWGTFQRSAEEIRGLGPVGDIRLAVIARDSKRAGAQNNAINEERWQVLQQQLTRLSTKSSYVIAQGSGHAVPLQRPEVIVEVIRKMVEQARSESASEKTNRSH